MVQASDYKLDSDALAHEKRPCGEVYHNRVLLQALDVCQKDEKLAVSSRTTVLSSGDEDEGVA